MKQSKEYVFKKKSIVFELVLTFIALIPVVLLLNLYKEPLIMLLVGLIPGIFLYFQIYSVLIIHQFNKYDAGKKVVISDDRSIFTLVDKSSVVTINNSDVEKVELYEQKSLGKFGTYSYMIIYTNDRKKLLVTQFTIPRLAYDNILQSFLRKKSRFYFKKTFNYIDEKQFKSID